MTTEQAVAPPPWSLMVGVPSILGHAIAKAGLGREETPEEEGGQDFSAYMSGIAATHDDLSFPEPTNPTEAFGDDGFGLDDFIDIVNPLQHLPVVSSIYRAFTGDELSAGARIVGGTLYGGPVGLASAFINGALQEETGKDVGGTVLAALFGDGADGTDPGLEETVVLAPTDEPPRAPSSPAEEKSGGNSSPESESALLRNQVAAVASPILAPAGQPLIQARANAQPLIQSANTGVSNTGVSNTGASNTGLLIAGNGASPFAAAPKVTQGQPQSPLQAAAQGVPTLSPDAATALMRMAQATNASSSPSANTSTFTAPQAIPVAPAGTTVPERESSEQFGDGAAPSSEADIPTTTQAVASNSESAEPAQNQDGRIGYVEPVASADLPSAMMEALSKYEAMKHGG